jgi:isocitrate lyase
MAENKKGFDDLIEKLALVSEGLVDIIPTAKPIVVFSLNESVFFNVKKHFNNSENMNQFKVDMSGVEFIFLKDELLSNVGDNL